MCKEIVIKTHLSDESIRELVEEKYSQYIVDYSIDKDKKEVIITGLLHKCLCNIDTLEKEILLNFILDISF